MDRYRVNIDTHNFNIEVSTLEDVRKILTYIENNIGNGIISSYSSNNKAITKLDTPIEEMDISNLPRDRYIPEPLIEPFLTNSSFTVEWNNVTAFKYSVNRYRDSYYIKFKFFGLIQYDEGGYLSNLSVYRFSIHEIIFSYADRNAVVVGHTRLDTCVDIFDIEDKDFFKYDIIQDNGKYIEWDRIEERDRNRYSRKRGVAGDAHVKDSGLYNNQYIVNIYDKGYKDRLECGIIRIEYKLLKRGIDKITRDNGSINREELINLLNRYRVLKFSTHRNAKRVLNDYTYNINHDKEGRRISNTNYYRKIAKIFPRLKRYMIDNIWLIDVEDVVTDYLYS